MDGVCDWSDLFNANTAMGGIPEAKAVTLKSNITLIFVSRPDLAAII